MVTGLMSHMQDVEIEQKVLLWVPGHGYFPRSNSATARRSQPKDGLCKGNAWFLLTRWNSEADRNGRKSMNP